MATLDLKPVVKAIITSANLKTINSLAQTSSLQTFMNLYMSPLDTGTSDLINRLGMTTKTSGSVTKTLISDFPPYNLNVPLATDRDMGFRQINGTINALQKLLTLLTGQIRTKITEWDLSLYFQELSTQAITESDIVSLLYRIYQDNPSKYSDSRALVYGTLNAALSEARFENWNPAADPDLKYWEPPTTEAELAKLMEPPQPLKKKFLFWQYSVPGPSTESVVKATYSPETAEDVLKIINLGWGTWYPEYWRLFFTQGGGATLGAGEQAIEAKSLNARVLAKLAAAARRGVSVANITTPPEVSDTGIELESPILFGRPYGKKLASSSLTGYLENADPSIPKYAPALAGYDAINNSYRYLPSLSGLPYLLNGWNSSYTYTTYTTRTERVVEAVEGEDGKVHKHTKTESIQVPVENVATKTGFWPTATATIDRVAGSRATFGKFLFPLGNLFNIGTKTTSSTARLLNVSGASGFDAAVGDTTSPLLLTSEDGTYACMAPFKKSYDTVKVAHQKKVLGITFTWYTYESVPFYEISFDQSTLVYRSGRENAFTTAPLDPSPRFPMKIKGIYFSFPARTLSSSQNVVTDGWAGIGVGTTSGAQIGKLFLTPLWRKDEGTSITAPVQATIKELNTSLLSSIAPALTTLQTTLTTAVTGSNSFTALIASLPAATQESPSMLEVKAFFSSSSNIQRLRTLVSNIPTTPDSGLQAAITAIISGSEIAGYTKQNLTTFTSQYPQFLAAVQNPLLVTTLKHWLTLLYALRIENLKKRINKTDGTLYMASQAAISHLTMSNTGEKPITGAEYILSDLEVVHKVTTVSLAARVKSGAPSLAPQTSEKVKIVYVPVSYTSTGEVVIPPAGNYFLYSQEIVDSVTAQPISFFITFKTSKQGRAPNIIKNVTTSINEAKLVGLMANSKLSKLEMICAARNLQDWWEIVIPPTIQPLASLYQNNLRLILTYPPETLDSMRSITGAGTCPVYDDETKAQPSQLSRSS